jgi:hypothetical protein
MRTKIRLHFDEELIPTYPELSRDFIQRMNSSISAKITKTIIALPCRPSRGESLNLHSFKARFGLSDQESEFLADFNYQVEIQEIVICDGFLELYVKKVE